jgi:lysine 2,3-aminomutase
MNFKANEVTATGTDGGLLGSSSPEEPGGKKTRISDRNYIPALLTDSERSAAFRHQYFPFTDLPTWNDWNWQIRNSITRIEQLQKFITPNESERYALAHLEGRLPLRITPYYLSLMIEGGENNPLRKMMIPVSEELQLSPEEKADSLNETGSSPVPGLIHRYPDRVLFLATQFCSAFCRYCTRSHSVGKLSQAPLSQWDAAIRYISSHPEIRDVLISGGDPLTLPDHKLEYLLSALRNIDHIEIIRIGTKVPVTLPQRITPGLVSMFRKYHPLWMSIHFSHTDEITPETAKACEMLSDAGIPLGSQTVLLRNINNDPSVMRQLFHKLLKIRVRPYYLYLCDLVPGSRHFRTPVSTGYDIMESLRGFTSGYAIPHFVIDAPGGGGKIHLSPDCTERNDSGGLTLRNYLGNTYFYPDTGSL